MAISLSRIMDSLGTAPRQLLWAVLVPLPGYVYPVLTLHPGFVVCSMRNAGVPVRSLLNLWWIPGNAMSLTVACSLRECAVHQAWFRSSMRSRFAQVPI